MTKLALLGGQPFFEKTLTPVWPPVNAETARRLEQLYYSGAWSAFQPPEGEFAAAFAKHHDATHGVFTVNGTVTMECALAAYGIGPGDEVIVPALTWCATAFAVHYVGATPVFVDIEPDTLCIDPEKIAAAVTERTKAIIPVHVYGSMADLERILAIARKHKLRVIEDCAHAHGGIWDGKHVGSWGEVGSFSFQHSKTMACADAGISITSDPNIAERLFRAKQMGYRPGEGSANVKSGPPAGLLCHNYRANAFAAVILDEQLKHLDARLERYARGAAYLEQRLADRTRIRIQKRGRKATRQGYFGWAMIFDHPDYADVPIEVIQEAMTAEGVRPIKPWGPVYRFVLFNLAREDYRIDQPCTVTEGIGGRVLWLLHAYLGLEAGELEKIGDVIEKVASQIHELRRHAKGSQGKAGT